MPFHMEDCHRNLDVVAPLSPGALVLATPMLLLCHYHLIVRWLADQRLSVIRHTNMFACIGKANHKSLDDKRLGYLFNQP